ncbi:hypothetical protein F5Y04DRAFT_292579 [Hypomontagnella monticulosa]|nr:hypothetical protein F5Y04DRAFT_292579 [Hypomontagnella monticulosa]
MKKGMRVVKLRRSKISDEQAKKNTEAARQRRATKAQAKLEAFHEFFKVQVPKRSPSPPTVETQQPTRVASPPVVQIRSEPVEASTPTIQTPFKNPYLGDVPLHWSPRMFKPEIDRYNWSWSSWDSPSREIEDVSYQTETWPPRDRFAGFPPHLQARIKEILAMKAEPITKEVDSKTDSKADSETDSDPPDTVRYEEVNFMESFSSGDSTLPQSSEPASSSPVVPHPAMPSCSQSPEFSSWVDLGDMPKWNDAMVTRYGLIIKGLQLRHKVMNQPRLKLPDLSPSDDGDSKPPPKASSDDDDTFYRFIKAREHLLPVPRSPSPKPEPETRVPSPVPSPPKTGPNDDDTFYRFIKAREHLLPVPRSPSPKPESEPEPETRAPSPVLSPTQSASPTASSLSFIRPSFALASASAPSPASESSVDAPYLPEQANFTATVYQQPVRSWVDESCAHHFHTLRQLPSASAVAPEPRQPVDDKRSGFGWKSLACVAAAAAAVGAGIAYWLS